MLLGQRTEDEVDRQRRIKKSRIYKEMLDNQIVLNQRYKKENAERSFYLSQDNPIEQSRLMPIIDNRKNQNIQNSFVHQMAASREQDKRVYLPLLKDKNVLIRGTSRFIKVDEPAKQDRRVRHVKTEQIEEDDEPSDDEYNSTCQKIIKELQSINKQSGKQRLKRRYNDYSQFATYKKGVSRNGSNLYLDKQVHLQNIIREGSDVRNFGAFRGIGETGVKDTEHLIRKKVNNPENRIGPQGHQSMADQHILRQPINQFDEQSYATQKKQSDKNSKIFSSKLDSTKKKQKINQFLNPNQKEHKEVNQFVDSQKYVPQNVKSQSAVKKVQKINKKPEIAIKSSNKIAEASMAANQQNHKNEDNLILVSNVKQNERRQNFLQLLRKVKNRGQSLFIKLSKFPSNRGTDESK